MNQSRPFLTAICFALFAAVFYSSNVQPESLYCPAGYMVESNSLRRAADDIRRTLDDAGRARPEQYHRFLLHWRTTAPKVSIGNSPRPGP